MNHLAKRTLQGALLIGGLWVIGQGIASADTVSAPANVPVIACGNSVGILSSPAASCPADSSTERSQHRGRISHRRQRPDQHSRSASPAIRSASCAGRLELEPRGWDWHRDE